MNALLEKGHISEMTCGSNFSYILSDNSTFLPTEYKVLQSQANSCFVKCMKMLYNGKTQLYYITSNLKPFSSLLPTLDSESFLTIVSNLFSDIVDVKHNGFLSCQNIDVSFERIYVEPSTFKVQLVYLPVSERNFADSSLFESELRTSLVKIISGISTLASPRTIQLSADLSNGMLSLEDLLSRGKSVKDDPIPTPPNPVATGVVRITAMNSPTRFELVVNKDEYTIGKSTGSVDGVIPFNKMISRTHCRIARNGSNVTITDLQSSNGTYVNKVRLQANQPCQLKNGDVIRLANSDFQVSIV